MSQKYIVGKIKKVLLSSERKNFVILDVIEDGSGNHRIVRGIDLPCEKRIIFKFCGQNVQEGDKNIFNVVSYEKITREMLEKEKKDVEYLSSGFFPGIGPVMAKRIIDVFGNDAVDVVENEPERLSEIKGLSDKKILAIKKATLKLVLANKVYTKL